MGAEHGDFGADSMTWRIGRASILLLGGARVALAPLAHLLVAMRVLERESKRHNIFDFSAIGIPYTYHLLPDALRVFPITQKMMRQSEEVHKNVA